MTDGMKKDEFNYHLNNATFSLALKELMLKYEVKHITVHERGESIEFLGENIYADFNASETGNIGMEEIDNSIAYHNHFVEDLSENE